LKIGLFFGSFNPVHTGHLVLATLLREAASLDEVWFVVSPQNPFKINTTMADERHRLEMVQLSLSGSEFLKASDVEFSMAKPSYTEQTLKVLAQKYTEHTFDIIIGEDNVASFSKWKASNWILENYRVLVYMRTNNNAASEILHTSFHFYDLPLLDISSTSIRERIKKELPISFFVTPDVEQYIRFHRLYH